MFQTVWVCYGAAHKVALNWKLQLKLQFSCDSHLSLFLDLPGYRITLLCCCLTHIFQSAGKDMVEQYWEKKTKYPFLFLVISLVLLPNF